jgi:long-chain acyl-CoA synthetase
MANTIYGLIKGTLQSVKDRKIISYYNRTFIDSEVLDLIDRFAYFLKCNDINKGDVVAICLPNIPAAVIAVYAVNKCGAIANLIHPLTPPKGLKNILLKTNSRMLIYLDIFYVKGVSELSDIYTVLCNVSDDMGMPMRLFARMATAKARKSLKLPNTIGYKECLKQKGEVNVAIDSEDIAAYLHSGGTSGEPKTIMISNRSINACAIKTGALVEDIRGNTDAMLMVLPLFHGFGLGVAMHSTIYKGGKVVMMPKFSPKQAVKLIGKEGVTFIAGVPQMYNKLMDIKGFNGPALKKFKNIYCGGDKLPKSIKDRFDALMRLNGNDIELLEGYGLTEMLTVSHVNVPGASRPSSVGRPLEGIRHKIIDENGNELPIGKSGEICLTGDTMMSGYLNDPEATDKTIITIDGVKWLKTGDCGYTDEDGFLYFRERIKRLIKISGINVFPQEIEYTVSEMDEIKYACALEMNYDNKAAVKLYVVLNKGYKLNRELEEKIRNYISERLMKYSVPKIIEARDSLPLTQIGKVDYMKLYEQEKEFLFPAVL